MSPSPTSSTSSTPLPPNPNDSTPAPPTPAPSKPEDPSSEVLPYHLDREKIVGGLVITYGETYAWFKRKFGFDLAEDHTEDLTIVENAIDERGYSNKLEFIQRQSSRLVDLLLVTQAVRGPFPDAGWIGTQVFQEEWKELLKPGRGEEAASEILLREFGIVATEFKCTFR